MIDSHAHLIWDIFQDNMPDIIQSSLDHNIQHAIHPCVELSDLDAMYALREQYPNFISICAGVHPCHANTWFADSPDIIRQHAQQIVAIGETGLDYFHKDISIDIQTNSFTEQCQLAKELNKPIIIHCRDAFEDTYNILKNYNLKGVMHCYTGDKYWAEKFLDLGFYISWSGILTYKRSDDLREVASYVPLDRTVLETDAPFLPPQNYRGKTNQPAYMLDTALTLANIKNIPLPELDQITTANTINLFNLQLD